MALKTAMEEIEGRKATLESQILHLFGEIEAAEAQIAGYQKTIDELREVRRDYFLISIGAYWGDPNRSEADRIRAEEGYRKAEREQRAQDRDTPEVGQ